MIFGHIHSVILLRSSYFGHVNIPHILFYFYRFSNMSFYVQVTFVAAKNGLPTKIAFCGQRKTIFLEVLHFFKIYKEENCMQT